MDVHLLVYDLSRGLAKQMSLGLLGFQLDAIYHTSIQLRDREYVYDGGIIDIVPGSSHLGQPMQKLLLGETNLPMDIIHDYLESVRSIFTLEAYDLFKHNCNNFTDAFSNFLLGKGIPSNIASMPQAVLDSPMGRMLLPQLTQGVNANRQNGGILGLGASGQGSSQSYSSSGSFGSVQQVSQHSHLTQLLEKAVNSAAIIFFTSATCPPCKAVYPLYDEMAAEMGDKVTLIKVDISLPSASDIGQRYSISATPTFITFVKGDQFERWSGADPAKLRANIRLLATMASPRHLHENLRLPTFANPAVPPSLYTKTPPIQKLVAKMDVAVTGSPQTQALIRFIETRATNISEAVLPGLQDLGTFLVSCADSIDPAAIFGLVDLFRCALVDPRISGFFAEEQSHRTICKLVALVNDNAACPYALRLITLQMACNLFSTSLFSKSLLQSEALRSGVTQLISSSFLDDAHSNTRVAAASLLFNVSLVHRQSRGNEGTAGNTIADGLPEGDQVELAASVVEAISQEEQSPEAIHGMLLALGHLVYGTDLTGELADLLRALAAEDTILSKKKTFPQEPLIQEVGSELLGKGLRKP